MLAPLVYPADGRPIDIRELFHPSERPTLCEREEAIGRNADLFLGGSVEVIRPRGTSAMASNLSLTFGLEFDPVRSLPQPGPAAGRRVNPIGRVTWGNGAGSFRADVDYHAGAQVSMTASSFAVAGVLETAMVPAPAVPGLLEPSTSPALNPGAYLQVALGNAIAGGGRPSRAYPTRTYPLFGIAPPPPLLVNRVRVRVPPFAYAMHLFTPDPGLVYSAAFVVQFQGGPGADDGVVHILSGTDFSGAVLATEGVRLPNEAQFVAFDNLTGAPVRISPMFTLNL